MLENLFSKSISWVILMVGFSATLYVILNPTTQPGTEYYCALPLSYTIMHLFCKEIYSYHHDSYGLKCFFIVAFFRYIILPIYACYADNIGEFANCRPIAYQYAIFVSVIEIILSFIVIKIYYPKTYAKKTAEGYNDKNDIYCDIGLGGVLFVLFIISMIIIRGHWGDILENARFLVVSTKFDKESDFWTYEIWAIQLLFAFFTIVITSIFQKRENEKKSFLNIIIPIIITFLSCSLILTNNRMIMVYYALCGLGILNYAFPTKKKILTSIILGAMFTVIISFTLIKNWSIDVYEDSNSSISAHEGTSVLSAYICGIDCIAHTYEMYDLNGDKFSIDNVIAEVVKFAQPMRLPGLVPNSIANTPTTIDLATEGTEMVSVAGETLFWGSPVLGWILDLIATYIIVRLLILFDIRARLEQNLGTKYIFSWMAVLFGIFMCYCIQTLWNNITFIPLYLSITLWINNKLRINKTAIENNEA